MSAELLDACDRMERAEHRIADLESVGNEGTANHHDAVADWMYQRHRVESLRAEAMRRLTNPGCHD